MHVVRAAGARVGAALGILCLLLCAGAASRPAWAGLPPWARARQVTGPIIVDGKLDEPIWAKGPWNSCFSVVSAEPVEKGQARVQTRFKVLHDDEALYVGVACDEPDLDGLKANASFHDGAVWGDDCIELFFDPGKVGRYYHHLIINSQGTVFDAYAADFGLVHGKLWNCAFESKGATDTARKQWALEVRIPFASMKLGEKPGNAWLFNLTRERYAGGKQELSSWTTFAKGGFHNPKRFGTLVGLQVDFSRFRLAVGEPQVSIARDAGGVRTMEMTVRVTNETGRPIEVVASASHFGKPKTRVRAEPVKLAAGGKAEIALPRLAVRAALKRSHVLLSFTDPSGRHVYTNLVKDLSVEYRPIAIELLRPAYRHNIYATEKLTDLEFRLRLIPDTRRPGNTVSYALADAGGKVVGQGEARAEAAAKTVTLGVADLPFGTYRLAASVRDANGKALHATATAIRKLPPPKAGTEVRIDEHRNVLIDGKPFLGIGWYGGVSTDDPRPGVVALQNLETPKVIAMEPEPKLDACRERFARYGIRSIVDISNGRIYYSFNLWRADRRELGKQIQGEIKERSAPSPQMADMMTRLIHAVKGEPWLLGYYISDEPEIHNFRSDYLENQYKLAAQLDPYHPVLVTNDTIDGIVTHGVKVADILGPDPYRPDYDYVPNFLRKVLEVGRRGKATFVTLWHSAGDTHFAREYGTARPYPYRVFRNQYLASVAYGVKGFVAYTSAFFLPEPDYYVGLPCVWRELRFLEQAMMAPEPAEPLTVEAPTDMGTWVRKVGGHLYLVVVNHKPGAKDARVASPLLLGVGKLLVASEGREVAVANGCFADHFQEGAARIYTTNPEAARLKTTRAVEAEIEAAKKGAARPGNLLHLSRGVHLRAAKGFYAPWFHQYFYYAVNGVTIDKGWTVHSGANTPSWLEILLPDEAEIARFVLYTPNFRDYTIEAWDADRWVKVVDVKGNTQTRVEHVLEKKVTCIKIRVTVTAAREGRPALSEIEAYAK